MITLNGYKVEQFQRCKRLHRIGITHRLTLWRPSSLLAACLRHAIFDLSSGKPLQEVSSTAVNYFLSAARSPGLDVGGIDAYTLAMDFTAIIRNVLEHLSRVPLLKLYHIIPKKLSEDVTWEFLSQSDESGALHMWAFPDYIPEDPLGELHSWRVFGDIAAEGAPMTLHMVAIGARSKAHQNSPWCKVYAHPRVANTFRFNKVSGRKLEGDWKPVYFSSNRSNTAKAWVDWMERDGAIQPLMAHLSIKEASRSDSQTFMRDVLTEARQIASIGTVHDPKTLPMGRYACDNPYICPHQYYCYTSGMTLDGAGMYTKIDTRSKSKDAIEEQYSVKGQG